MDNKSRLLREEDIIRAVDKHISDDGSLDNDISCILEEVKESNDNNCLKKELLRHKIALFKMIHQFMYTITDENGVEYFDDYCESAGEMAFSVLGFEHDKISKEDFFKRYDECSTELYEMSGVKNICSCILEEVKSPWIKCIEGQMPEDFEENNGKKIINVLVTTSTGKVTKVQRMYDCGVNSHWYWGRIYGKVKAWMPLPEPYVEQK